MLCHINYLRQKIIEGNYLYNDTSIIFVINRLLFCKELSDVLCGNGDFYYCIDLDYLVSNLREKIWNNVHEFVWNKSRYNKVEIDVQGIKLEDKKICELKEIDRVFLYKGFFLSHNEWKKVTCTKNSRCRDRRTY